MINFYSFLMGGGTGGGGSDSVYGVVVVRESDPDGQLPDTLSVVQGTYEEAQARFTSREPVIAVIYYVDTYGNLNGYGSLNIEYIGADVIEFLDSITETIYSWTENGITFANESGEL